MSNLYGELGDGPQYADEVLKNEEQKLVDVAAPTAKIRPIPVRKLYSLASRCEAFVFAAAILGGALGGVVQPSICYFLGEFLNIVSDDSDQLSQLLNIMLGIGVAMLLFSALQVGCGRIFQAAQRAKLSVIYYEAVLNKDISWFDCKEVAALPSQMADDLEKMGEAFGEKLAASANGLTSFVAALVYAFVLGPQLAAVMLCSIPVLVLVVVIVMKSLRDFFNETQTWYDEAAALVEEVLFAVRTVVSLGGEVQEMARYGTAVEMARRGGVKSGVRMAFGLALMEGLFPLLYALALYVGMVFIVEGVRNPVRGRPYEAGDILTIFFLVITAAFQVSMVKPGAEALAAGRLAGRRFFETVDAKGVIQSKGEDGRASVEAIETLELCDVKFSYPARPEVQVLRGIDIKIKRGQRVAVVGESGSGKSTVMSLLERFYDCTEGAVQLNGVDIRGFSVSSLRRHIGYVGQEPVLFASTIRKNIMSGCVWASSADFARAQAAAQLGFVDDLPEKLDTFVGAGGNQFSGGQKQRIAIARALLKRPSVLFLDEATSALDGPSERLIQETIERLSDAADSGMTVVSIAHRLSTVIRSDMIYVLSSGRVVEEGTHSTLVALKGVYYGLAATQGHASGEEAVRPETGEADAAEDSRSVMSGRGSVRRSSLASSLRQEGAALRQDEEEKAREKTILKEYRVPMRRLLQFCRPEWWHLSYVATGAAVHGASMPIAGYLLILTLSHLLPLDRDRVEFMCLMYVVLGVVSFLATFAQSAGASIVTEALTMRMRQAVLKGVLRQEIGFHDDPLHSPGRVAGALQTWAFRVSLFARSLDVTVQMLSSVVAGLVIGFVGSWRMALIMTGALLILLPTQALEMAIVFGGAKQQAKSALSGQVLVSDSVQNARTVHAVCMEEMLVRMYKDIIYEGAAGNSARAALEGLMFGVANAMPTFISAGAFYYVDYLVSNEIVSWSDALLSFFGILYAALGAARAVGTMGDTSKAKVACHDVFQLLDRQPLIDGLEPTGSLCSWPPGQVGHIEFWNVSFSYPFRAQAPVLKGLSFKIASGMSVGLCGPSGGGKSTIFSLLQRFYDPGEGRILIGSARARLDEANIRWWRLKVGYVGQEPILFNTTILQNVLYGLEQPELVSPERLEECKRMCNLGFIDAGCGRGWETAVGPRGGRLSGGQKQRVAICRAILRDPPLLLLDEATSALDSASEAIVQLALQEVSKGRTTIAIAHRLSTIVSCDRILVCAEGVILEQGTHAELMAAQGVYSKLHASS